MGTLRFFEEVVSFKIRRTFGFADYIFSRTMPAEPLPFQMLTQLLFQNIPR